MIARFSPRAPLLALALTLLGGVAAVPLLGHVPQLPRAYLEVFGPPGAGQLYIESKYLPPVTTGPWSPAWSPSGDRFTFAMRGSVWKVPANGGTAVQITEGPHYDSEPDWSPDGQRIAFTRDTGDVIDIWTVNADGSEPRRLTDSLAFSVNPRWSPDGESILFVTMDGMKTLSLSSVSVDDGNVQPVLADEYQNITPSWSPDGKEIVFVSNRRWDGKVILGTGGLWKFRPGEPEPTLLLQEETVWHARPTWSPDGAKIAYSSFRSGHNQLWVASATAGNPLRLTYSDREIFTPAWSPDGESIAYISNAGGDFTLWTVPATGGKPSQVAITGLEYPYPVGRLDVVVRDAETGEKTQARAYLSAADGKGYAPQGAFHRMVVVTNDHYFHTDGSFTAELPVGPATVEVMKGFEYHPQKRQVEIVPGQTQTVELTLERWIDMPARGWYSGDNHVHMNYGGLFDATPTSVLLEADAEDLHVINNLVANQAGTRIHDLKYFEGKLNAHSKPNRLLYFNEEYRASFAGHMSLLNLKEFIHPQFTGFEGSPNAAHYPTNAQVLDAAHAQGAIGGYVHPFFFRDRDRADDDYQGAREFPVGAALGNVDYYDVLCIWSDEFASAEVWYRVLNLGFRVPLSAGTDAMTDYWRAPAIGTTRVYVRASSPLDYADWIQGLAGGRSFATNGPLVFLTVEGREPGDEVKLPAEGSSTVKVEAEALSIFPMETLDILQNGKVVYSIRTEDPYRIAFETEIPVEDSGWVAARVTGPEKQHLLMDSYVYAHTGPVYLAKGDRPARSPKDAQYFLKWIDRVLELLEASDAFDTPAQKRGVLGVWREARSVYAGLAAE